MEMIENRNLSEQIYEVLRDRIVSLTLEPGRRLLDAELASEFGVSRTPVRQALDRLAAEGLCEVIPRRGTFVAKVDAKLLRETCEIRSLIEKYAAERGGELVSAEQLERMSALIDECEGFFSEGEEFPYERYLSRDVEFHALIVKSSQNDRLVELYNSLSTFLQIGRVRSLQQVQEPLMGHEEHKLILKAYRDEDSATLVELIDRHISRVERELLSLLDGRAS